MNTAWKIIKSVIGAFFVWLIVVFFFALALSGFLAG